MNKKLLTAATLAVFATAAHAQSSVTLYGVIDAGISYVNNSKTATGHDNLFKYDDGVAQGSRWGLRGTEDLGGGLKALFVLENGFNSGNGTLGQGGALFGRQAYVGLSQNNIGSLTFGRQYSFSTDYLGGNYSTGGQTVAGNYAYHINDVDQLTSSRINNAVKFSSANFAGLTFGAMYGFSNQAGAFAGSPTVGTTAGSSRAYSFGVNYANGPFGVGAAYTDIRFPSQSTPAFSTAMANVTTGTVRDLRTFGVGGRYTIAAATLWALYTNTRFEPITGGTTTFAAYEAGAKYAFTPALTAGAGYTYMHLSNANKGHWNQADLSVDYALSKRTDVYALGIYQIASGHNAATGDVQAQIGSSTSYFSTSGTGSDNQLAFRVGIRHKF
ncbi:MULTISPECIES: porin [unclassified Paraburkholderia]|uniref:porin n=1 Tax=unclassified Paraburkholderia TaxID=2615204 RepID=UPI000D084E43|nr:MULTISPECIES: porin [unclassified Paraburkholderia]PRY05172.1 putative porin [Paraburkholderia sp. BL25I1N1]REE23951.1 putative porin [Paraburkholderia sp. BL27I4N3]REG50285.1 putative porin [Paraburkholderia sp. BL6669N2]RKR38071.1 putative porin [Paraburkholderia sp. BL17N1]TDY22696.1 putative porin [Paraburkholderia sp. BL6665CI2N2]